MFVISIHKSVVMLISYAKKIVSVSNTFLSWVYIRRIENPEIAIFRDTYKRTRHYHDDSRNDKFHSILLFPYLFSNFQLTTSPLGSQADGCQGPRKSSSPAAACWGSSALGGHCGSLFVTRGLHQL